MSMKIHWETAEFYTVIGMMPTQFHSDVMIIGSCNTDLITWVLNHIRYAGIVSSITLLIGTIWLILFDSYTKEMPRVGQTVHGYKFAIGCGGKGANQCVAAAKLGASTVILAKVKLNIFVNYTKKIS